MYNIHLFSTWSYITYPTSQCLNRLMLFGQPCTLDEILDLEEEWEIGENKVEMLRL